MKIEFIEELIKLDNKPIPIEDEAPTKDLQDDTVESYSTSDGSFDLKSWEQRELEEDLNRRDPVILEADILKFDFKELARIQLNKY